MKYQVLLFENHEGEYKATVPALSGCTSQGRTEEEAIDKIRKTITELLSKGKIVMIDVPEPEIHFQRNPWLETFGIFKDDPNFDEMMRKIYQKRSGEYPE